MSAWPASSLGLHGPRPRPDQAGDVHVADGGREKVFAPAWGADLEGVIARAFAWGSAPQRALRSGMRPRHRSKLRTVHSRSTIATTATRMSQRITLDM